MKEAEVIYRPLNRWGLWAIVEQTPLPRILLNARNVPTRLARLVRWTRVGLLGAGLAMLPALPIVAQSTGTVSGRVTDADNGQPIVAAQVTIDGTTLGRATGDDGRYSSPVSNRRHAHASSCVASATRSSRAPSSSPTGGTVTADFALAKSSVSLAGVVVTATGEERKKEVGNAITTVGSDDFETRRRRQHAADSAGPLDRRDRARQLRTARARAARSVCAA